MTSQARKEAWAAAMVVDVEVSKSNRLWVWGVRRGRRQYTLFYWIWERRFELEPCLRSELSGGCVLDRHAAFVALKVLPIDQYREVIAASILHNHAQRT